MKSHWIESFKEWFGYSRRERRYSFILLVLIIVIAGSRYIIPDRKISVEKIPMQGRQDGGDTLEVRRSYQMKINRAVSHVRNKQKTPVELNTCDSASLEALPGIGPVLAARIIKYRNLLGGFAGVSQLHEVYGLSEETFNIISGRVIADPSYIRKIRVNSADFKQIIRLPYLEKAEVSAILKYRELKGKIGGIDELIENKLIAAGKADKIRPYLKFD